MGTHSRGVAPLLASSRLDSGRRDPSSAVPPQDASARGELFLGSEADGYRAAAGLAPPGLAPVQGHHAWPFGITVVTPERTYLFACESQEEQRDWLAGFHRAIRRPMLPQEYAGKVMVRPGEELR